MNTTLLIRDGEIRTRPRSSTPRSIFHTPHPPHPLTLREGIPERMRGELRRRFATLVVVTLGAGAPGVKPAATWWVAYSG